MTTVGTVWFIDPAPPPDADDEHPEVPRVVLDPARFDSRPPPDGENSGGNNDSCGTCVSGMDLTTLVGGGALLWGW